MEEIDSVKIYFNPEMRIVLNVCLAVVMFSVSLDLKFEHFTTLFKKPKAILVGLASQFLVFPIATLLLVTLFEPIPSIALGMILVAVCPGGNISNFFSAQSHGNVALSISLTALSSASAVIFTPINFAFWASLYPPTSSLLQEIFIDPFSIAQTLFIILFIPMLIGTSLNQFFPSRTEYFKKPIKKISIIILVGFILGAFASNYELFIKYFPIFIIYVID